MLVALGVRDDGDVHALGLVDLAGVDLREDQVVANAQGVIATAVERLRRHAAEVADARQSDVDQTVEKLVHFFAAQSDHRADGLAFAELEAGDGLLGLGDHRLLAGDGGQLFDRRVEELASITGQKPVVTRAKKSIAAFKLREGVPIGTMVTLRGEKMYEFLDRLINIALPRVRDFRGVPTKSFDGRGNYTLGIRDHLIFAEIDAGKVDTKSKGMNITIVTTAKTDEHARVLLRELGLPFGK